ncbi:hypothetical protein C8R44DRAFT_739682 [Mycena epipterygia]|nr:hypothetical protein C8R44DRAFT_739682 [Mycena epipterygia]
MAAVFGERDSGPRFRSSYSSTASTASKTVGSPGLNTACISTTQLLVAPIDAVAKIPFRLFFQYFPATTYLRISLRNHLAFDQDEFSKIYEMLEDHSSCGDADMLCRRRDRDHLTPIRTPHKTLAGFIKKFVANAHHGGLPGVHGLVHLGAKTHMNAITGANIGDSVLVPTVSPNLPTLVIECGRLQTHPSLLTKMDKWLANFGIQPLTGKRNIM